MANYAKVALTGTVVSEPKSNSYNGSTVISFRMSVYTTKKVEDKYVFDYYNVSYWGKPAETIFPKLKKDSKVQVYGDQYQEEFTSSSGEKRLGVAVRATDVILLDAPKAAPKKEIEEEPF